MHVCMYADGTSIGPYFSACPHSAVLEELENQGLAVYFMCVGNL